MLRAYASESAHYICAIRANVESLACFPSDVVLPGTYRIGRARIRGTPLRWLSQGRRGRPLLRRGQDCWRVYLAFRATDHDGVHAFHTAAMANGASTTAPRPPPWLSGLLSSAPVKCAADLSTASRSRFSRALGHGIAERSRSTRAHLRARRRTRGARNRDRERSVRTFGDLTRARAQRGWQEAQFSLRLLTSELLTARERCARGRTPRDAESSEF
jgi:hypothetical protein